MTESKKLSNAVINLALELIGYLKEMQPKTLAKHICGSKSIIKFFRESKAQTKKKKNRFKMWLLISTKKKFTENSTRVFYPWLKVYNCKPLHFPEKNTLNIV